MTRFAALCLNGIALGMALCGLLVPVIQYALQQMLTRFDYADEAAFVAGTCGAIAMVLALILRFSDSHKYLPIAGYMNTGALILSILTISLVAALFVTRESLAKPEKPKKAASDSNRKESAHPVRRGKEPNVILVFDYTVELDSQLISDLNLTPADVETVLKRQYDPQLKRSETDELLRRGPSQDPRLLPRQIIRLDAGRPLYLEDIAIIRDPTGKALK